jgi:hypothetical protein
MWKTRPCHKIRDLLWDYAAMRLDEQETAQIERHLSGCASCRMELARKKQMVGLLFSFREAPSPESKPDFQQVWVRLREEEQPFTPPARLRFHRLAWTGAATACAAFGLLAFLLYPSFVSSNNPSMKSVQYPPPIHFDAPPVTGKESASDNAADPGRSINPITPVKIENAFSRNSLSEGNERSGIRRRGSYRRDYTPVIRTIPTAPPAGTVNEPIDAPRQPLDGEQMADSSHSRRFVIGDGAYPTENPAQRDYVIGKIEMDTTVSDQDHSDDTTREIRVW